MLFMYIMFLFLVSTYSALMMTCMSALHGLSQVLPAFFFFKLLFLPFWKSKLSKPFYFIRKGKCDLQLNFISYISFILQIPSSS